MITETVVKQPDAVEARRYFSYSYEATAEALAVAVCREVCLLLDWLRIIVLARSRQLMPRFQKEGNMQKDTYDLSLIAYYLSKYDMDAVHKLGYQTRTEALREISALFGHANAYLKLRRDEFDVVTDSRRKGWRNREPAKIVAQLAAVLDQYSFDELSQMISGLVNARGMNKNNPSSEVTAVASIAETSLEDIVNGHVSAASLNPVVRESYQRVYDQKSLNKLKEYYHNRCQICGCDAGAEYGVGIAEIHHIIPFSESQDNSLGNLIVLCPNHHRLIHKTKAEYDPENCRFILADGMTIPILLTDHLQ